jgi:hypothetical protein
MKPSGGCETLEADGSGLENRIDDSRCCERCRGRNLMGVASLRREWSGLSGHTLKGSQSPGEAEVAISRCGCSVGTENLMSAGLEPG